MSARVTFLQPTPNRRGRRARGARSRAPRIRDAQGGSFVWVVNDGRVRRQAVSAGAASWATRSRSREGLLGGEALVVGDVEGLAEGRAVELAVR